MSYQNHHLKEADHEAMSIMLNRLIVEKAINDLPNHHNPFEGFDNECLPEGHFFLGDQLFVVKERNSFFRWEEYQYVEVPFHHAIYDDISMCVTHFGLSVCQDQNTPDEIITHVLAVCENKIRRELIVEKLSSNCSVESSTSETTILPLRVLLNTKPVTSMYKFATTNFNKRTVDKYKGKDLDDGFFLYKKGPESPICLYFIDQDDSVYQVGQGKKKKDSEIKQLSNLNRVREMVAKANKLGVPRGNTSLLSRITRTCSRGYTILDPVFPEENPSSPGEEITNRKNKSSDDKVDLRSVKITDIPTLPSGMSADMSYYRFRGDTIKIYIHKDKTCGTVMSKRQMASFKSAKVLIESMCTRSDIPIYLAIERFTNHQDDNYSSLHELVGEDFLQVLSSKIYCCLLESGDTSESAIERAINSNLYEYCPDSSDQDHEDMMILLSERIANMVEDGKCNIFLPTNELRNKDVSLHLLDERMVEEHDLSNKGEVKKQTYLFTPSYANNILFDVYDDRMVKIQVHDDSLSYMGVIDQIHTISSDFGLPSFILVGSLCCLDFNFGSLPPHLYVHNRTRKGEIQDVHQRFLSKGNDLLKPDKDSEGFAADYYRRTVVRTENKFKITSAATSICGSKSSSSNSSKINMGELVVLKKF